MRSHPQHNPQPRIITTPREPGPDPRPKRRRSTEPLSKETVDQATEVQKTIQPATAKSKPRKGKTCGSSKPRYVLTKALLRLALEEGLHQLAQERSENDKVTTELSRPPKKEQEYHEAFLEAAKPEELQDENEPCVVSIVLLPNGEEELVYHTKDGPQVPTKPAKTLDQIMNERKLRRIIETSMSSRVTINVGDLLAAAMKDPRLKKLIEETTSPALKPQRVESRAAGGTKRRTINNRPLLTSSHTVMNRGKNRIH